MELVCNHAVCLNLFAFCSLFSVILMFLQLVDVNTARELKCEALK